MVTVAESASALKQGNSEVEALRVLSLDENVPFTQYVRHVLPLDGFVFWLATETVTVKGSLHVTVQKRQEETATMAVNRVMFSTGERIQKFNDINPNKMWVGRSCDSTLFAFTSATNFYQAAGIYHYLGDAVYPPLASQLLDVGEQLPSTTLVVSDSLPMWLTLYTYSPVWLQPPNPKLTLYPSYAVPDNLEPPYGVVHISPSDTHVLQAIPLLGPVRPVGNAALGTFSGTTLDSTHWQLSSDEVRVTLYGATNQMALDFLDLVNQYSFDQDTMGIMSVSPMRDEKMTQPELGILAMKKTIAYRVSYYQARANAVARQLIQHVKVTYVPIFTLYP